MEYIPVLVMMAVGFVVGGAILLLTTILGPSSPNRKKDQPFECGVPIAGDARQRFSVRFYLVAILFLLFDVEGVFFYPFGVVFKEFIALGFGKFILIEMGVFTAVLVLGFYYVLKRGALEWD